MPDCISLGGQLRKLGHLLKASAQPHWARPNGPVGEYILGTMPEDAVQRHSIPFIQIGKLLFELQSTIGQMEQHGLIPPLTALTEAEDPTTAAFLLIRSLIPHAERILARRQGCLSLPQSLEECQRLREAEATL